MKRVITVAVIALGGGLASFGGVAAAGGDYPPDAPPPSTSPDGGTTPPPSPPPTGELPETGTDSADTIKLAGGALVAGAGLVIVAGIRRRPTGS